MPQGSMQGYEGPGFTKKRVRRKRPQYKSPIGPPAPGHRRPGPFPRSPSTTVAEPPGPVTRRRKIRRFKRTKEYKRAIKAARRSARRAERRQAARETLAFLEASRSRNEGPLSLHRAGFDVSGALGGFAKRGGSVALDVLEETTRPLHGLAGATLEGVKGGTFKEQGKAFVKGVKNEEKHTFSDVLKELGAPKIVQTAGGFALDVFADPTTYVTFGTASVARKAALAEGERVFNKAVAKGMSEQGAATVAKRAAQRKAAQLAKEGKDNKGLTVGIGKAKTSGKTTAKLSRKTGVSQTAKKIRGKRSVQAAGENLRPDFRPLGAGEEAFKAVRGAERTHRAVKAAGEKKAQQRSIAYSKALKREDHKKVIDALESGKVKDLPDNLRDAAVRMRSDFRYMHRLERQRGIAGKGRIADYFPHRPAHELEIGAPKPKVSATRLSSAKTRKIKQPLSELREEAPWLFSEDVPLVFGTRAMESARGIAKADFLKAVAKAGRKFHPDAEIDTGLESVYKVTPTGITELGAGKGVKAAMKEAADAYAKGTKNFIILNKSVAERALKGTTHPSGKMASVGRFYDRRLQGPVKTLLTVPNPQYHFTNLYGDLFNAYLADTKLKSFAQSYSALRRLAKREAARKTLAKQIDPTDKGVMIGGKKFGYDELIAEAEEHGGIRTGFIGEDLPQVLSNQAEELAERLGKGRIASKSKTAKKIAKGAPAVAHPINAIRNLSQYREDFVRLATYIEARKAGLSAVEAAERVAKFHFDYGELTELERGLLRRVFPFYTFTARNTPLQAERLIARPGKYANLQKVREEFTKAAGLPDGWEENLQDYEQRGLPIPLPIKDSLGNNLMLFPKLPAMDLGRLTVNPTEQFRYGMAMLTPLIKSPVELLSDYNFFFGEPITNPEAPLVPAPDGVSLLPASARKKLGIVKYRDKKSGKMIWGWPAKVDYVARLTPLSATGIQMATDAANQRGQGRGLKAFGYATGLKLTPYDPAKNALNKAFEEREKLSEQMSLLRYQDKSTKPDGSYRPEYRNLLDKTRKLSERIYRLKKKAGYKILPTTGAPSKSEGFFEGGEDKSKSFFDGGGASKGSGGFFD